MNRAAVHEIRNAQSSSAPEQAVLLDVKNIRRTFGETVALDSCSLQVRPGEIHSVVGENGSGKSTLIKIMSGIVRAESGSLHWDGKPARFHTPKAAQRAGIATVFQETLVLPDMTVRDNVMLGLDGVFRPQRSRRDETTAVREALSAIGIGDIHPEVNVGSLSLARRQLVGVARSLVRPWRLLILDESTSAIDIEDRNRLFEALDRFRAEGRSILFVSHRMDEIDSIADRATVLRSGNSIATLERGKFTSETLLELMSTSEGARAAEGGGSEFVPSPEKAPVVTLRNLSIKSGVPGLDLDLHAGEIIGVGGLEGHGQEAFLECVAGLRRPSSGDIQSGGRAITSRARAVEAGIAFLPRDRKSEGIFAPLSVMDNVTVSALRALSPFGVIHGSRRRSLSDETTARTKVKMANRSASISSLSGGNQQKALLGRLVATRPKVLVLNDPLRGVDLGAKRDLYAVLAELAAEGVVILLLSTELVELCLLCNRVIVFHNHAPSAVVGRRELDERALIEAMFGQSRTSAAGEVNGVVR